MRAIEFFGLLQGCPGNFFFKRAGGGADFFCFSTRWRYVSNRSWPGPAALWRVFVQRFHSAQHGEGEGGAGRGFALPRPEELVRSGSAGWVRENRKRAWAYTSKKQRGLKDDARAQVAQPRQAPKGSPCTRKPTAPPVLPHGPSFHQDKTPEDYAQSLCQSPVCS